jgi:hypothetical protein
MEADMWVRVLLLLVALLPSAIAMAQEPVPSTSEARLKGVLLIQWNDEKRFIYVVDPQNPLRLELRDGRVIQPGRMYTDGGSIPRVFWSVRGFSPWGYAPAYVLHDWLFHQHRCGTDAAPNNYSFEEANQILDDVIGILFKDNKVQPNEAARGLIKWAVDNFAQQAWQEACGAAPPSPVASSQFSLPGAFTVTVERLSFGD